MHHKTTGVVGIAVSLIAAGGIIVLAFMSRDNERAPGADSERNKSLATIEASVRSKVMEDPDGDGLADWEEALWKTETNNPDSDGDGTKDGDEVNEKRDPTKRGPNDALAQTDTASSVVVGTTNKEKLNETQKLGHELFAEYLAKKQRGEAFTEKDVAGILTPLAASVTAADIKTRFTIADLRIGTKDDTETVRAYGNTLGAIERRHSSPDAPNEIEALARYATDQNADSLKILDAKADLYNGFITEALAIEVPPSAAIVHLTMLNTLDKYAVSLKTAQNIETDPLGGLYAAQRIAQLMATLYTSYVNMGKYFKNQNIVFNENEMGYVFTLVTGFPETPPAPGP